MGIDPGRMKEWGSNPRKMMVGGCLLRIRPPFLCILRLCLPGCSPCFAKRDVTGQVGSHPTGWEVGTGRMCFTYDCNFRFFCLARNTLPVTCGNAKPGTDADVAIQVWRLLWWPLHAWSLDIQLWRLREQALSFWWFGWFGIVWESHQKVAGVRQLTRRILERLRYLSMPKPACSSWFPTLPNTWSLL